MGDLSLTHISSLIKENACEHVKTRHLFHGVLWCFTMDDTHWVEMECASAEMGDARLKKRMITILRSFFRSPRASIPEASSSWPNIKAAYRFLNNPKVSHEAILASHREASEARFREEEVILAIQDTAVLNYTHHPETEGLGPVTRYPLSRGMLVHTTLAFTPEGVPLGIIDQQAYVRKETEHGKKYARHERPLSEKESEKWFTALEKTRQTRSRIGCDIVTVGDREADIYELFQTDMPVLIRAAADRKLSSGRRLWGYLSSRPVRTMITLTLPKRKGTPEATIEAELRFAEVEITPPKRKEDLPPVRLNAVYVRGGMVSWMLLTNLSLASTDDALRYVRYYGCRFSIEVFHKALKSGCRIEERQLKTYEGLKRCLALYSIIAWRIMFATMVGRSCPSLPCTVTLEDDEWKALVCYMEDRKSPPRAPPSLGEAIVLIAKLGGFIGRRRDGHPGVTVLWRGMRQLQLLVRAWHAFRK